VPKVKKSVIATYISELIESIVNSSLEKQMRVRK
jgi:hypothetical protein